MIAIDNVSLYFGAQNIFDGISFMINKGDKIGLVGKNGSGKSTLLKLLTNDLTPNEGKITSFKDIVIGYLEQDIDFQDRYTLIDEMRQVFKKIESYKKNISYINQEMSRRTDYESPSYIELINQLTINEEALRLEGGYDTNLKINKVLKGLGFHEGEFDKPTSEFSGGWRMRIELAKILMKKIF